MKYPKISIGGLFLLISYILLFLTLYINNAILLLILLPFGIILQIIGILIWVKNVWREASQKGVI